MPDEQKWLGSRGWSPQRGTSARREALAIRVMWSLDNYQPRITLQFEARELPATLKAVISWRVLRHPREKELVAES